MGSPFKILEVGKRGLWVAQKAFEVVEHNVANAADESYSRQRVLTSSYYLEGYAFPSEAEKHGWAGEGVKLTKVERIRNQALDRYIWDLSSQEGYWKKMLDSLEAVETVISEPESLALKDSLGEFFDAWQELSKNPESLSVRQTLVEKSNGLVFVLRNLWENLGELRRNVNSEYGDTIKRVNAILKEIAKLNSTICSLESVGEPANDARDRRDALVEELAGYLPISVSEDLDGSYNIYTEDGKPLVVGTKCASFGVVQRGAESDDPDRPYEGEMLDVVYRFMGKEEKLYEDRLRAPEVRGEEQAIRLFKEVAGLTREIAMKVARGEDAANEIELRREKIGLSAAALFLRRDISEVVASTTRAGTYIYDRETGEKLLEVVNVGSAWLVKRPGVSQALIRFVEDAIGLVRIVREDTGDTLVNQTEVLFERKFSFRSRNFLRFSKGKLKALDELRDIVVPRIIKRVNDISRQLSLWVNIYHEKGVGLDGEGGRPFFVDTSGSLISAGAAKNIKVNADLGGEGARKIAAARPDENGNWGPGDGTNALIIARLRTAYLLNDSTETAEGYWTSVTADVGTLVQHTRGAEENNRLRLEQMKERRKSISGVSLDEEATVLMRYQHMYSALARVMSVFDRLLSELVNIVR